MSRLARKPIILPEGVAVALEDGKVSIKGPKGELQVSIPRQIEVKISPEGIALTATGNTKQNRADLGTTWSLLRNAAVGTASGYQKVLEIEGVGYRAALDGQDLMLSLGYVNPVRFKVMPGASVAVDKNTITVSGINKEVVGQVAAEIRKLKKPEPYKGKGIRYQGEVIRRKAGKKAVTGS